MGKVSEELLRLHLYPKNIIEGLKKETELYSFYEIPIYFYSDTERETSSNSNNMYDAWKKDEDEAYFYIGMHKELPKDLHDRLLATKELRRKWHSDTQIKQNIHDGKN